MDKCDIFIQELLDISKKYIWKIHYTTFRRLRKVQGRYKRKSSRETYLKGKLGEEYVIREYIYPALHQIPNAKYKVRRRYRARRRGNGDIDVKIKINDKNYIGNFIIEVKNWDDFYDVNYDMFKEKILKPLQIADKNHKYQWLVFINRKHVKHIRRFCKLYDIKIIPLFIFLDRDTLDILEELFDRTYIAIKNRKYSRWDMNICIGAYRK